MTTTDWKKTFAPKVTIYQESDGDAKEVLLDALETYWEELKPRIENLLVQKEAIFRKDLAENVRRLYPVLYSEDKNKHGRNISRYNTLDEVLALLEPDVTAPPL